MEIKALMTKSTYEEKALTIDLGFELWKGGKTSSHSSKLFITLDGLIGRRKADVKGEDKLKRKMGS